MIDVGGAALLGAAARNGAGVAAVGSPDHYGKLVGELKRHHAISAELRPVSPRRRSGSWRPITPRSPPT